jgi:hypothetical protein
MAYSDYGAFVYRNDERRVDKEDSELFVNDSDRYYDMLYHGVLGDGDVRVGCYKQGWPDLYLWCVGGNQEYYGYDKLSRLFGWSDYDEYDGIRYAPDHYDKEFDFLGWHFHFVGSEWSDTPKYMASMKKNGEKWECYYDYMYGAGISDVLH